MFSLMIYSIHHNMDYLLSYIMYYTYVGIYFYTTTVFYIEGRNNIQLRIGLHYPALVYVPLKMASNQSIILWWWILSNGG